MPIRIDEPGTDPRLLPAWEGGVGWIAHPAEAMQRASHLLVGEDGLWIVEPVALQSYEAIFAALPGEWGPGDVVGVTIVMDRHRRDAAALAEHFDVPVVLPEPLSGLAGELPAETVLERGDRLGDSHWELHPIARSRLGTEVALYHRQHRALYVPEALGSSATYVVRGEPLGVHPVSRLRLPRVLLEFDADRILVGHGDGVSENAAEHVERVIGRARRDAPRAYAGALRAMLPL